MNRSIQIHTMKQQSPWDVIVIGGGATGLGIAVDCATRGYNTLLVEASDFAKGTSSKSTKLLHGGVRYLAQGHFPLVYEALHERDILIRNAPHLCKAQSFVIPTSGLMNALYYFMGLLVYDYMAGPKGLGNTRFLSQNEAHSALAGIKAEKMRSGVCYGDGQFDDARLAVSLARTAHEHGACLINYMKVVDLIRNDSGQVNGVWLEDMLDKGQTQAIHGHCIINATGVFTDSINHMDAERGLHVKPSQGIHLVIDRSFLPSDHALMVPKTSDGRVLFAIPWHGKVVVGTTDTPVDTVSYDSLPLEEEIDFLIRTFNDYSTKPITRDQIASVFVGLRPLVFNGNQQASKDISRSHKIAIAPSGLIHVNGGKWTTYRNMAQETVDRAIEHGLLSARMCVSDRVRLHGYKEDVSFDDRLCVYGSDAEVIMALERDDPKLACKIHEQYPYTYAQVLFALEYEMAQTLEDVLARRIRLLFLDVAATLSVAEEVAIFMAKHQRWSQERLKEELEHFTALIQPLYLIMKGEL